MMRKVVKSVLLAAVLLVPSAAGAQVELTGNAGYFSHYYYRGLLQKTSSANGGLDLTAGGFSLGSWAADVGDGSEVDVYTAYAIPLGSSASVSIGGTGYFYTGQFDNTYLEGNLGLAFGPIAIDAAVGSYRTEPQDLKYTFFSITAEKNGLFATVGTSGYNLELGDALSDTFDRDAGNQYVEAGYGFTAADLDFTISGIYNDANLSGEVGETGEPAPEFTVVLGVSKTFAIPID